MANTQDPAVLQALIDEVSSVVRRAFADGYRHGTNEAIDRMARAASFGAEARLPNLRGNPPLRNEQETKVRMSPPRQGIPGAPRAFQYGSVIGLCRQALLAAPGTGLTRDDFIVFCRGRGTDATPNQIKDVIKRLIGAEEAERHDGLIYPGRRLQPFVDPETTELENDLPESDLLGQRIGER